MSGVSINQSISISSTSTPCPSATMLVAARASTSKQAPPRIHQVVHLWSVFKWICPNCICQNSFSLWSSYIVTCQASISKDDHLSRNLTLHDAVASSWPPPPTCPGRGWGRGGRETTGRGEVGSYQGEERGSHGEKKSSQGEIGSSPGEEGSFQGEKKTSQREIGSFHGEEGSFQGEMGSFQAQADPTSLAAQLSALPSSQLAAEQLYCVHSNSLLGNPSPCQKLQNLIVYVQCACQLPASLPAPFILKYQMVAAWAANGKYWPQNFDPVTLATILFRGLVGLSFDIIGCFWQVSKKYLRL